MEIGLEKYHSYIRIIHVNLIIFKNLEYFSVNVDKSIVNVFGEFNLIIKV